MQLLETSIDKVGVIESISVTQEGTIISGHARKEIFDKKGMVAKEIKLAENEYPVIVTEIEDNTKEYFEAQILANTTANKNFNLDIDVIEVIAEEYDIEIEEVGVDIDGMEKSNETKEPPRTDLKERVQLYRKSNFSYVSIFKKSKTGQELKDFKKEDSGYLDRFIYVLYENIRHFAKNKNTCIVCPPPRRHKDWNLAQQLVIGLQRYMKLNIDVELFKANTLTKYNPDIELNKPLIYDNYIIIDDIITTGQTIDKCIELLNNKNVFVFCLIDNH
jgi:hypothetical protein